MITSPDGTFLLALNQASENDGYQVGTMGALAGPTVVQLPSGFTPFSPAIGSQGKYLNVSHPLGLEATEAAEPTVGSNGVLTAVATPVSLNLQQMEDDASGKFTIGTSGGTSDTGGKPFCRPRSGLSGGRLA